MPKTQLPKKRLLRSEERQAQILLAASRAFGRGGYAATSMDDVAAEAGITRLIVYRHFASKELLYRAVLTAVADHLRDEFQAGMAQPGHDDLRWIHRMMLTVARQNPDGFRLLMVHAAREPQFVVHHDEWEARARSVAAAMIGDRLGDPALKAWAMSTIVTSLVASILAWLDCGSAARDDEFVDRSGAALGAMYRAWSGAGSRAGGDLSTIADPSPIGGLTTSIAGLCLSPSSRVRSVRGRYRVGMVVLACAVLLLAACSSTPKSGTSTTTTTTGGSAPAGGASPGALGVGVTAHTVKVGVALVNFTCIEQYSNSIRQNEDQIYKAFIDYINAHGGVAGRHIVADYQSYCPYRTPRPCRCARSSPRTPTCSPSWATSSISRATPRHASPRITTPCC